VIRAAYAATVDADAPLSALKVGPIDPVATPEDWVTVTVRASSLNHHDLWSLRGVGLTADQTPMILGCDAAGVDEDGTPVIVHAVLGEPGQRGDETLDPRRSLLSERYSGTLADEVRVPRRNLVPLPEGMSFTDAACLPTAWLTAYKMLIRKGRLAAGDAVLVQGAGGGVATAAVVLATALGARVYATSRSGAKRERIAALGATALESGARLPERVDVVVETVGADTLEHSMKCAAPGGRIVLCGTTSGHLAPVDLRRLFFLQLELLGATMGTRDDLAALVALMAERNLRPVIDSVHPFAEVPAAFARLHNGDAFGKIVLDHTR
jgi:NADPH:quinone reductase-like Zn-dependent oxidoreductase